jgi:hypothetical protein
MWLISEKMLQQYPGPSGPIDFHIVLLAGENLELLFLQKREKSARLEYFHVDALEPKTGLGQVEEVPHHRGADPFAAVLGIDDQIKRAVVGYFEIRHEKERSDGAGYISEHPGQTRLVLGKSDPIPESRLHLFLIESEIIRSAGLGKPAAEGLEIFHGGKTNVKLF